MVFRIGFGEEIEDSTVGTFNSILRASGFAIPACAGRSLEADNTEQRVYDPDSRDETGE